MIESLRQDLTAFHFTRPAWLLVLLPAIAVYLVHHYRSGSAERWRKVIDAELLIHLLVGSERPPRVTPNGLLLVGWILAGLAIAGPTWRLEASPFADNKPPVMVVLKVTDSMMARDLAPTRLDRARQKLSDFLAAREGAATGLIAYAGSAHLVLPPTTDKDVLLAMAGALSAKIMPADGDALSSAIAMADAILSQGRKGGAILVLADTVAADQITPLSSLHHDHGVSILSLVAPDSDAGGMDEAARVLGADAVPQSVDQSDIATIGRFIDRQQGTADIAGEGRSWQEAGYWLTPFLFLLVLGWFRRGWVLT